jgi:hypothetical protein
MFLNFNGDLDPALTVDARLFIFNNLFNIFKVDFFVPDPHLHRMNADQQHRKKQRFNQALIFFHIQAPGSFKNEPVIKRVGMNVKTKKLNAQ